MKILKIILLVFSLLIVTTRCDFPTEKVKQDMFDSLNGLIDNLNYFLFNVHAFFQGRFDANVATLWLYWRSTQIYANSRGFATAADNRTELTDCLSSFDDLVSKVINHMNNDVMKPIFDMRKSDTKIEDDLSTQLDELKDLIVRSTNTTCLRSIPLNEYYLNMAYSEYRNFIYVKLIDVIGRTDSDYHSRFNYDFAVAIRHMINLRSSIMISKTRNDYNNFIKNFCKPIVFAKFEKLIDTSTEVIAGASKDIYGYLNQGIEKLPTTVPFSKQLQVCL